MSASKSQAYLSPNRCHDKQFFYKYMSADIAKIILVTKKLRWSSPILFNDPFDTPKNLHFRFGHNSLMNLLAQRLADLTEHYGEKSHEQIKHPILSLFLRLAGSAPQEIREKIADAIRNDKSFYTESEQPAFPELDTAWAELIPLARILCVSEVNDETTMWLHYADRYRGVVFEFSANDILDSVFLVAKPVIYQDEPPSILIDENWVQWMLGQGNIDWKEMVMQFMHVKKSSWSYEKEWRIASFSRPGEQGLFSDYEFHPRELTGIYFGSQCEQNDIVDLTLLVKHGLAHVKLFQAVQNNRESKFTFTAL